MKAVMWEVPPEIVELRRRTGADERDEVWEGVLHLGPSPNIEHQRIESALEFQLRRDWQSRSGGEVLHQINVSPGGDWKKNYRIPDLILRLPGSRAIDRDTKAVEIYSLAEGAYRLVAPDGEGWCASAVTGLELRGHAGRVELRWADGSEA